MIPVDVYDISQPPYNVVVMLDINIVLQFILLVKNHQPAIMKNRQAMSYSPQLTVALLR
jgi:hypothetical protein